MSFIPYARHSISEADIESVVAALKSDRLTQGPLASKFAAAVAEYCGARYAVPMSNASMALIAACRAAGVGPGDRVWTTPNTFIATANCALHCGAEIDFVDIDPVSYNLSIEALQNKLIEAEKNHRLPNVVIPVHFAGQSCDMAALAELADQYRFTLIEDAAHALGGSYQGSKIGSCQYSEMTVFSFHPVKSITAGEGGMVLTNNPDVFRSLLDLAEQGMVRDTARFENPCNDPWYYEQQLLGYNLRMTEIQAALGLSQLTRLNAFISRRQQLAAKYGQLLEDLPVNTPEMTVQGDSAWHLYVVTIDFSETGQNKAAFVESLKAMGVGAQVHYIPVHTQPFYQRRGFAWGDYPVSETYYAGALSLPLYPGLTDSEQAKVVACLSDLLK